MFCSPLGANRLIRSLEDHRFGKRFPFFHLILAERLFKNQTIFFLLLQEIFGATSSPRILFGITLWRINFKTLYSNTRSEEPSGSVLNFFCVPWARSSTEFHRSRNMHRCASGQKLLVRRGLLPYLKTWQIIP